MIQSPLPFEPAAVVLSSSALPIPRPRTRMSPQQAEAAFRTRLAELGATLLEPSWLGVSVPHRVRCAVGHECTPRPANVRKGTGACRACAGRDPKTAEAAFRARLAELGATLLESTWLGVQVSHRVRCAAGHSCTPRPASVQQGHGICRTCAGKDPQQAEAAFRARLAGLGATLLEPTWLGVNTPHRVRCAASHDCAPTPGNARRGEGVCRTCAGKDPQVAEAAFRARLAELGATLLEPAWLGANTPHRVRCAEGHDCTPRPSNIRDGDGLCRPCAGRAWNVLYVVADDDVVKFGITSGDPRPRLRVHKRDGLDQIVRLFTGLPIGVVRPLEDNILAALRDAREEPVRGREYFPARALPLILDLIDHHPEIRASVPPTAGAG